MGDTLSAASAIPGMWADRPRDSRKCPPHSAENCTYRCLCAHLSSVRGSSGWYEHLGDYLTEHEFGLGNFFADDWVRLSELGWLVVWL